MADLNRPRIKSENEVWDTVLLEWVPMQQPATSGGGGGGSVNLATIAGVVPDVDYGSSSPGTLRVMVASNQPPMQVTGLLTTNILDSGGNSITSRSSDAAEFDWGLVTRPVNPTFTASLDFDVSNNPIYVGLSTIGSAKSASAWQIRKLTFDGSNNLTDVQYANGTPAFNQIWNNRVSLSYS